MSPRERNVLLIFTAHGSLSLSDVEKKYQARFDASVSRYTLARIITELERRGELTVVSRMRTIHGQRIVTWRRTLDLPAQMERREMSA